MREPDLDAVNRALSVTVQKLTADLKKADADNTRLTARVKELEARMTRLASYEAFTQEGWGFSHPEITARVEYARAAITQPAQEGTNET
jgi:cell division protein FtsB